MILRVYELCKSWQSWNLKMHKTHTAFSNLSIKLNFFIIFFYKIIFTSIKISKNSSAKYYQDNKERLQIRAC